MITLQKLYLNNSFSLILRTYTIVKMHNKCTVAVCQMTSSNNKAKNLETVKRLVSEAVHKKAKMVFLPEACDYIGSSTEETKQLAENLKGPLIREYINLAKSNKIWLSIGGFHEAVHVNNDIKLNNCHIVINDIGDIVGIYKKLHLFDVDIPEKNINLKESDVVIGGNEIVPPIDTPAGQVGLEICYDVRFPELSVLLRKKGATILTFPSAFTSLTGKAHWEVLLRARAIENQCYVIAAAQYGVHNPKRVSYGQSLVIDPWGGILGECKKYSEETPTDESLLIAEIDVEALEKIRPNMPILEHRRDDIYRLVEVPNKKLSPDCQEVYMFADKIIKSSTVFLCTRYSFAFTNIRCVVPGHVLVSSRRVARRLEDLTEEEIADLFQCVVQVQKVMEVIHGSGSSTICVQDGKFAGQTVPHVHVHILPRKQGDFARNDDVYHELANHDRDDSVVRPTEEMINEAQLLRKYFY